MSGGGYCVLAHADWSGARQRPAAKRWAAVAVRAPGGGWRADAPAQVDDPQALLAALAERAAGAGGGAVLLGLDCPLGLPAAFVRRHGLARRAPDFPAFLDRLAAWPSDPFLVPCARLSEVGPARPFFPAGPVQGAGTKARFLARLGLTADELLRLCDRAGGGVRAACGLFWTLGADQAGKAAIAAWRELLGPARHAGQPLRLWPFEGDLASLATPGAVVVAETYPAEAYLRVGLALPSRKRRPEWRAAQAGAVRAWARAQGVALAPALAAALADGFGPRPDGEDPFDAVLGLMGMVPVAEGRHPEGTPPGAAISRWEGWMLGRAWPPPQPA